jgi:protein SCO1/2
MRISALAGLLLVAVAAAATTGEPAALPKLAGVFPNPAPAPVADFTLTDHLGKPRAFSSLRGEPVLVFFGFTHCANVCPTALGRLKLLHESQGGRLTNARVVLVSVDGERDTPARLRSYLAPLSADFIGLTGDPKLTAQIAARFAVDKAGRLRASFADASIEDMAKITTLLLEEPG